MSPSQQSFDTNNSSSGEADLHQVLDTLVAMTQKESLYSCSSSSSGNKSSSSFDQLPCLSPQTVIIDDDSSDENNGKTMLTSSIRREVCQWMYKVIDHYSFERNIVAIGMNYFIRFISETTTEEMDSFELTTATALYLAIKLYGPKLSMSDNLLGNFARMSSSRFDETDIVQMEAKMLTAFAWLVHPVTPQDFIPYLVNVLSYYDKNLDETKQIKLIELSIYIVELVVFNPIFEHDRPSSVACASIAVALNGIDRSDPAVNNPQNPFDRLSPLFTHGLVHFNTVFSLVEELNTYLKKVSPTLNDIHLDIDPTGILFKHAAS